MVAHTTNPSRQGGGEWTQPSVSDTDELPAQLLVWLSPAFPIGSFAYSHGLERAAEIGVVKDRGSLQAWLSDLLEQGSLRNDLILLSLAWRAVTARDSARIGEIAELAAALQPSAERHFETVTQGEAFLAAIEAAWPTPAVSDLRSAYRGEVALPVAVATAAAGHSIGLRPTLQAYALSFISNLVSASIRLSVIGQTDGQRILASLLGDVRRACTAAELSDTDQLGTATFAADLASLEHETQYTRLFRS